MGKETIIPVDKKVWCRTLEYFNENFPNRIPKFISCCGGGIVRSGYTAKILSMSGLALPTIFNKDTSGNIKGYPLKNLCCSRNDLGSIDVIVVCRFENHNRIDLRNDINEILNIFPYRIDLIGGEINYVFFPKRFLK